MAKTTLRLGGLATLAAALILAAGCGGDDNEAAPLPGQTTPTATSGDNGETGATAAEPTVLEINADESALKFDQDQLEAPAGTVTIRMMNPASLEHNVALKGNGVDEVGAVVGQDGVSEVTAELAPGTYTFYCSVKGHAEAGMTGTLTIN